MFWTKEKEKNVSFVLLYQPEILVPENSVYDRTEFTEYRNFDLVRYFWEIPNFSDKTRGPRANLSPLFTKKLKRYWEAFSKNSEEYFIEKFTDFKNF